MVKTIGLVWCAALVCLVSAFIPYPSQAQQPSRITLDGDFAAALSELANCIVCVPPGIDGSIHMEIDYQTGTVTGRLEGEGGGQKTISLCDANGQVSDEQGTAQGQMTLTGSFSGSINPQSGALTASGTINGFSSVSWLAGCAGCPTSAGDFARDVTIEGVVIPQSGGQGELTWSSNYCSTTGSWSAQTTSIRYPATATPTIRPSDTPSPTFTTTVTPTSTPTATETSTPSPTPSPTLTLTPSASPTQLLVATATHTPVIAPASGISDPGSGATGSIGNAAGADPGTSPSGSTTRTDRINALVKNLEEFLLAEGAQTITPGQAAAASAALASLLTAWLLLNLVSGIKLDDLLAAINAWRNQGSTPTGSTGVSPAVPPEKTALPPGSPTRMPVAEGAEAGTHRTLKDAQDYIKTFENTLDQTKTLKDNTINKLPDDLKNNATVKKVDELTNTTIEKIKTGTSLDQAKNLIDKLNEHAEMHQQVDNRLKDRAPEGARDSVKAIQSAIKHATDPLIQASDRAHDAAATAAENALKPIDPDTAKKVKDAIEQQKNALRQVKEGVERVPTRAVEVATDKRFGEYWKDAAKNNPEISGIHDRNAFPPPERPDFGKGWRKAEGWYEEAKRFLGRHIWQLRDTSKPPSYYR